MKVVRNDQKGLVNFEDLLECEIFLDVEDCVYLKIPKVVDDENRHRTVNAINLEDDYLTYFCATERVKKLDYELVIQN